MVVVWHLSPGPDLLIVDAATPFTHGWGHVRDVMSMHGKWGVRGIPTPDDKSVAFAASHYAQITTGCSCSSTVNGTGGHTIEDAVLGVAARIKAVNASVPVGMYWRSGFAGEVSECSGFAAEWSAHPEWRLLDDSGKPITRAHGPGDVNFYFDFAQAAVRDFFARVLVNVTRATLPSGAPVLDYIYIDNGPKESLLTRYAPGISAARSAQLVHAQYAAFGEVQAQLDAAGHGQRVLVNSMDSAWAAKAHVATGVAGSMFDHWSIIEFLEAHSTTGEFNASMVDAAFSLVTGPVLSNVTTQVKGWPGPIVAQKDVYPKGIPTPSTPAQMQAVAASRFNSELALFLLVASQNDFWVYSWFWGWEDYVPGMPDSTVPDAFFPQADCALGSPLGPYARVGTTWTYTRDFEHASVFVDLTNRTNSYVKFDGCGAA